MNSKDSNSMDKINRAMDTLMSENIPQKGRQFKLTTTDDSSSVGGDLMIEPVSAKIRYMEKRVAQLELIAKQRKKEVDEIALTKNTFISIIAHDLRSPFTSIFYALELLKQKPGDHKNEEIEQFLDLAIDTVNRTLSLLENLLEWTISQNGDERKLKPVTVNLNDLIAGEAKLYQIDLAKKQIMLRQAISSSLAVAADIQMLKIVIRNLISNAIKFTGKGGKISIVAADKKQFVEVAVKDNGIGISAEDKKRIFTVDRNQLASRPANKNGFGLGLVLCKEFVELHGGMIWVDPSQLNGSEFKFTLPKVQAD